MDDLPITGFDYFGLKYDQEEASVSFGPLECKGEKAISPGQSCADLKLQGETVSGYYQIGSGESKGQGPTFETVFCDFDQPLDSGSLQERVAPLCEFHVLREKGDFNGTNKIVVYDKVVTEFGPKGQINIGNGVFTAPYSGMYEFYFGALTDHPFDYTSIYIRHNWKVIDASFADGKQYIPMFIEFHLWMGQGDTVDIWLDDGGLRILGPNAWETHFGGKLLYI